MPRASSVSSVATELRSDTKPTPTPITRIVATSKNSTEIKAPPSSCHREWRQMDMVALSVPQSEREASPAQDVQAMRCGDVAVHPRSVAYQTISAECIQLKLE